MSSWASIVANKSGKAPAGSSSRPSSSQGTAAPTKATFRVATPVAGLPAEATTSQSQPTAEEYEVLPEHLAAIAASNSSFVDPQQTAGGQQGPTVMASTGSAFTSGPGAGAWSHGPPPIMRSAVSASTGQASSAPIAPASTVPTPTAPLSTQTASGTGPATMNPSCPRCGQAAGHREAYLCD